MKYLNFGMFFGLIDLGAVGTLAQEMKYPPVGEYLMPQGAEISLAKSAATDNMSGKAPNKILAAFGFQVVHEGDNGFVCMVMRGFGAPTFTPTDLRNLVYDSKLRAPICFDPQAAQTVVPYYELRHKLGLQGRTPDEIAKAVLDAYSTGALPKMYKVSFAYMLSAD